MSLESHPPVPPGCAYFANALSDGKLHFLPTASLGNGSVCVESLETTWGRVANAGPGRSAVVAPAMRGLIAAVARCAWLDEAGNTGSSGFNICWEEPYGSAYLSEIEMERVRECIKLADAWAKWGRGEEYNA